MNAMRTNSYNSRGTQSRQGRITMTQSTKTQNNIRSRKKRSLFDTFCMGLGLSVVLISVLALGYCLISALSNFIAPLFDKVLLGIADNSLGIILIVASFAIIMFVWDRLLKMRK